MSVFVDIEKKLGSFNLSVKFKAENEILALLGASGCGKSMTLKCIAGIEKPDRGIIKVDDRVLFDSEKKIDLTPQERRTGFLFQNYALFPNMTVYKNIRAGAVREKDSRQKDASVLEIMEKLDIEELRDRYPHQLSGGQQQRAALARILVSKPDILLLDEPFSALDQHLRFRLETYLGDIIREYGKTAVWVSHDRDEVYRQAETVAIMSRGKIDVSGPIKDVFAAPKTRSAASITGCKNISPLKFISENRIKALDFDMEFNVPEIPEGVSFVGVRMNEVEVGTGENSFVCEVLEEIENPFSFTLMVIPKGSSAKEPFLVTLKKNQWLDIKAKYITINIAPEHVLLLRDN